jgi:hypothetical protein
MGFAHFALGKLLYTVVCMCGWASCLCCVPWKGDVSMGCLCFQCTMLYTRDVVGSRFKLKYKNSCINGSCVRAVCGITVPILYCTGNYNVRSTCIVGLPLSQ